MFQSEKILKHDAHKINAISTRPFKLHGRTD